MIPLLTLTVLLSTTTAAQAGPLAAAAARSRISTLPAPAGGDSLGNGATAGAITGGVAAGVFIAWICHNLSEEGDGPCWKPALVAAGLGAGAGALVGIGIDAAFQRKRLGFGRGVARQSTVRGGSRRGALMAGRAFTRDGNGGAWSFDGAFKVRDGLWAQGGLSTTILAMGEYPACPPGLVCVAIVGGTLDLRADAISVAGNLLVEVPSPDHRLHPYVVGGAGLSSVRRELRHRTFRTLTTSTSNDPFVTVGAGADFSLGRGFAVGAEARYERAIGGEDFGRVDIPTSVGWTRAGVTVSYRR